MIASEAFLGVKPASEYIFVMIASPVGSYFKGGSVPVSIGVGALHPCGTGGTGAVKCGGDYAASLRRGEAIGTAATRWCSSTRPSANTSRTSAA